MELKKQLYNILPTKKHGECLHFMHQYFQKNIYLSGYSFELKELKSFEDLYEQLYQFLNLHIEKRNPDIRNFLYRIDLEQKTAYRSNNLDELTLVCMQRALYIYKLRISTF